MLTLRTVLAGLAASMARDEAEAVRTVALAETPVPEARVFDDPLAQDERALVDFA
jgi:hypothetical protein